MINFLPRFLATLRILIVAFALAWSPCAALAAKPAVPIAPGSLQLFSTEADAQRHCPRDEVVWLNTNSEIYHEKVMRWYGHTHAGAYVCRRQADAAGDRDTRNGQ